MHYCIYLKVLGDQPAQVNKKQIAYLLALIQLAISVKINRSVCFTLNALYQGICSKGSRQQVARSEELYIFMCFEFNLLYQSICNCFDKDIKKGKIKKTAALFVYFIYPHHHPKSHPASPGPRSRSGPGRWDSRFRPSVP